jgi:hypothetical protein
MQQTISIEVERDIKEAAAKVVVACAERVDSRDSCSGYVFIFGVMPVTLGYKELWSTYV